MTPMCAAEKSLVDLRREIDAVDDQMHDLIIRRAELTLGVKAAKARANNHVYLRLGREAQILRRLAARHSGNYPLGAVVRIWREMLCAQIPVQGPFAIAVATSGDVGLWDTARDHFGSNTAMTGHNGSEAALDAVVAGKATLAVLPEPTADAGWWPHLMAAEGMHILMKLPFVAMERRDTVPTTAYIAGLIPVETSDADMTVIATRAANTLGPTLHDLDLEPHVLRLWPGLAVAEVAGFLAADDDRVRALEQICGDTSILGVYPIPLTPHAGDTP